MNANARDQRPLRLGAFEEYMFRDDRPEVPMMMPTTLVFRGRCDFAALNEAFAETVAEEPLFRSVVQKVRGRWSWVPADRSPTLIDRSREGVLCFKDSGVEPVIHLDLRQNPGVQCEYWKTDAGFALRFFVHHAICDGLGTVRFLGNWFARYGRLTGETEGIEVFPPDPDSLARRENLQIELPHPISTFTLLRSVTLETSRWIFHRPSRLRPLSTGPRSSPSPEPATDEPSARELPRSGTALFWKTLPEEYYERLRAAARGRGLSVNTLVLGCYFQTLAQWIESSGRKRNLENRWIRVLMPTNLRKPCHDILPATNLLGYAFFDRKVRQCHDLESLCRVLQEHINLVKDWSMGAMFLSGVEWCRRIPGCLALATSRSFCHSTSVFSNIGNPCRAFLQPRFRDDLTIRMKDLEFVRLIGGPPVRPNTPLSGGFMLQGRSWTLSVVADLNCLDVEDVRRFQALWLAHLDAT